MINITRLNGTPFTLNADLIEMIEEVPDTVITLTTGKKVFVAESRETVKALVLSYKQSLYSNQVCFQNEASHRQ
ncbi:MAG: flagellar protein FlbD [Lachnospiraceae bacterium]|nr:flagellar protein FlbD [Lachnospiraceae bacterium]